MAKSIQEALAEVQRKINEVVSAPGANPLRKPDPVGSGRGTSMGGPSINDSAALRAAAANRSSSAPRPIARPIAAASAPRPAASAGPSNADIYARHGVGGNDEAGGAFFRAQADIAARDRAAAAPAARPAPAAAPRPSTGNPDVLKQQKELISQGHKITADGIMGPKTQAALDAQKKTDSMKMGRGSMGAAPAGSEGSQDQATALNKALKDKESTQNTVDAMSKHYSDAPSDNLSKTSDAGKEMADKFAGKVGTDDSGNTPALPSRSQQAADEPIETESGPNKGKKKMSESALIDAFLKLQNTNHSNIFEAAKKMKGVCPKCGKSPCQCDGDPKKMEEEALDEKLIGNQKKLDKNHNNKLDSQDFKMLRGSKKMEEAAKPDFLDLDKDGNKKESMKKAAKDAKKMEEETIEEASYSAKAARAGKDIGKPGKQFSKISSSAAKRYGSKAAGERVAGAILAKMRAKHGMEEEVTFSDEELAHIASIVEEAGPVDQGKGDQRRLRGQQTSRGIGDTVPNRDLTDEFEYIDEMARGVKAGTKRGSYKNTKSTRGGMSKAEAPSMPDEAPKGVPDLMSQIRHGHEDEHGFKEIEHPASTPEAPMKKRIHRSELHGVYDKHFGSVDNPPKPREKEKIVSDFYQKHFGDSRTSVATTKGVKTDDKLIAAANAKNNKKVSLGGSKLVGGSKKEW
jgi:hypothetical protein